MLFHAGFPCVIGMSQRVPAVCAAALILLTFSGCWRRPLAHVGHTPYDVVLANGRAIDPESGLDAVRNVGIRAGRIAAISQDALPGHETIDVRDLVIAPGFIDLHAHGQDATSAWLQARDGVTTALDMEIGVFPVGEWYASRAGTSPIHYGAAVGHIPARLKLKHGVDVGHRPTNPAFDAFVLAHRAWAYDALGPEEMQPLLDLLDLGLREGAPGVGMGINYTPAAGREEVWRVFQLAAARAVTVFVHLRFLGTKEPGGIEALQEVLADAATTGASVHVLHVTSMGLAHTPIMLAMIEAARQRGIDVSVEAYPYTAASTRLASALFDPGWQEKMGISYGDLQWTATGERLTQATFERYRKQPGGGVVIHMIPPSAADVAITHPLVMIASDGIPFRTGGEHPRGAGTFARVLGHYVRERGTLSLTDALRKMTLMPAQRLEKAVAPMRNKGRLRIGADADITVFDPERVRDRATYEQPMQASEGIAHVLVGGTFVVRDGAAVAGALPGQPVRTARVDASIDAGGK